MSRITDYGFLFQTTFGTSKTNLVNNIQLSQMNSSSVQKQLKAAGIDTNSKKYKAALSEMMKNGNGAMFTNVQAIKNLMSQYDKNGDWIDPNTGKKVFLLAQSYMPAQQIHILVNPTSRNLSPWYELTETDAGKLYTPEWIFEKKDLKRFK